MAARGSGPLRAAIFLTLAMFAGGASIVILTQLIGNYQREIDEARRPEDTVMVIVAARDLYQGVTITEEDLYAVEIPPKYLPDGVFLSPEHVVGRIPRERVLANEFIRADRLADPESGVGLNAIIPRGMRAISVSVRDGEALSGFLNPLNYVDVLVTVGNEKEDEVETRTLLQAVFVLGVNSRMQRESREEAREKRGQQSPSVTLLVTAEEAEQLAHAEKLGRLRLTLRNDLDVNFTNLSGVDATALRGRIKDATPKETTRPRITRSSPAGSKTQGLKIIRGDSIDIKQVDEKGLLVSPGAEGAETLGTWAKVGARVSRSVGRLRSSHACGLRASSVHWAVRRQCSVRVPRSVERACLVPSCSGRGATRRPDRGRARLQVGGAARSKDVVGAARCG